MDLLLNRLQQLVAGARERYARLVLLVGQHGTGKTRLLRDLASAAERPVIDVGGRLPLALFDVPSRKRPVTAADTLGDMLRSEQDPVIIDNIEVLFDPLLKVDPLKLLQDNARNRVVVAAWPGAFDDHSMTFADAEHPEFRSYPSPDAEVLVLGR